MSTTIPTETVVTVNGLHTATVLAPEFGSVNDETVVVGYVLRDSLGRCFAAPLGAVRVSTPLNPWETATD